MLKLAPKQSGFTLLELLTVIVIMGTLASLVSFSVGIGDGASLRSSTQNIAQTITLLRREAELQQRIFGLRLDGPTPRAFHITEYDLSRNIWFEPISVPSKIDIPDDIKVQFHSSSQLSLIKPSTYSRDNTFGNNTLGDSNFNNRFDRSSALQSRRDQQSLSNDTPDILLFPGGEISDFEISVMPSAKENNSGFIIRSDGYSELSIEESSFVKIGKRT